MKLLVGFFALLGCLWISPVTASSISVYEFEKDQQRERFYNLIDELRCPKCQNQNVAGSDAPISEDIKQRVYKLMKQGKSDDEIVNHLVDRYGEYITYRPPVNQKTWVLWFGPALIFVITVSILVVVIKRRQSQSTDTNVDQERVQDILKTYGSGGDQ